MMVVFLVLFGYCFFCCFSDFGLVSWLMCWGFCLGFNSVNFGSHGILLSMFWLVELCTASKLGLDCEGLLLMYWSCVVRLFRSM